MTSCDIDKTAAFSRLPSDWPESLIEQIGGQVRRNGRRLVVLDDDPTGTQTVHGVPVLTRWSLDALVAEFSHPSPALYLLTNSRSLTGQAARELGTRTGHYLARAADQAGVTLEVVSRSDSTLRGHFPGEVDALADALGAAEWPCVIMPFFLEGGRLTIDDVHYVAEGDRLVPAARTTYAQDAAFGYRHSHLARWIAEKTNGRTTAGQVASISLDDLRNGGPSRVAARLASLPPASYCVVNAVSYRDVEVFVAGLLEAEGLGSRFIFRTAASFVRVRAGLRPRGLINARELTVPGNCGGLFVVGSYVPKTNAQLDALLSSGAVTALELPVAELLEPARRTKAVQQATRVAEEALSQGKDTVVYTSRQLITSRDADTSLNIGRQVSDSLIAVIRGIGCQPRYLVAKGGITSSDVATKGLDVSRAMVMGQVLPGVPAWQLGDDARYPGMAYIVFPGNVGSDDALVQIRRRLAPEPRKGVPCS